MENIKQLRQLAGFSQQKFADYFDIPRRTIQNWEADTGANARTCPPYLVKLIRFKLQADGIINDTPPD